VSETETLIRDSDSVEHCVLDDSVVAADYDLLEDSDKQVVVS
jgi:hypothetical protein